MQHKQWKWQMKLSAIFIFVSFVVYVAHYYLFNNLHDIFFYMVMDIAFMPISVLILTFVINRILSEREKETLLGKLNMVIGAFFSETGRGLLMRLPVYGHMVDEVKNSLIATPKWTNADFHKAMKTAKGFDAGIEFSDSELVELKAFLLSKREFMLRLLENPILLEHKSFTDLLWAVFHLIEELEFRNDFSSLPMPDHDHLKVDIKRVYGLLIYEWLAYLMHLKRDYPFLYSLAIRINPLNPNASATIKE